MCYAGETPNCRYHPQNKITNFCLHSKCILPLCQQCVAIHRKQNPSGQHMSRIILLRQAKNIAISSIKSQKQYALQLLKQFNVKYSQFRLAMKLQIQRVMDEFQQNILKQNFNYNLNIYDQKIANISINCLKQLINHYESGNVFLSSTCQFQWRVNDDQLRSLVRSCLDVKNQMHQQKRTSTTLEEKRNQQSLFVQNSIVSDFITKFNLSKPQIQNVHAQQKQNYKNQTPQFNKEAMTPRRKIRPGIFVASSPNQCRNLAACNSVQLKNYKLDNEQQSISRQLNRSKLKSISGKFNTEAKTTKNASNKSCLRPHSTKNSYSQSKKHYQFPQKVLLIEERSGSKKNLINSQLKGIEQSRTFSNSQRKQVESQKNKSKIWKDVINKSDIASKSSSSRLVVQRNQSLNNQCLNPQQMRQLIMKKRNINIQQQYANCAVQKMFQQKLTINSHSKGGEI